MASGLLLIPALQPHSPKRAKNANVTSAKTKSFFIVVPQKKLIKTLYSAENLFFVKKFG